MVLTQVDLEKAVVHPLVLLSVVDHFNRMKKIGNQKRVVGLLLGSWSSKGILDIANSFAIPPLTRFIPRYALPRSRALQHRHKPKRWGRLGRGAAAELAKPSVPPLETYQTFVEGLSWNNGIRQGFAAA